MSDNSFNVILSHNVKKVSSTSSLSLLQRVDDDTTDAIQFLKSSDPIMKNFNHIIISIMNSVLPVITYVITNSPTAKIIVFLRCFDKHL